MSPDWRGGIAPYSPRATSRFSPLHPDARKGESPKTLPEHDGRGRGDSAAPLVATAADLRRASAADKTPPQGHDPGQPPEREPRQHLHQTAPLAGASSPPQSIARSTTNSQHSVLTASTDQVVTPPASDTSAGAEGAERGGGLPALGAGEDIRGIVQGQSAQLLQLSAIAAAQDRIMPDAIGAASRKRMADGEVKARSGSASPVKGHSRTTSAVSVASTTGSSIGELSAELKTRLSYAMVKVSHGWQSRSLDEVESLASQAVSPTSSTSTVHGRHGSSASPRLPIPSATVQVHFARDPIARRRKSNSPPSLSSNKPTLAPPAPIHPSIPVSGPGSNPRRNSNSRYTPTMLSHSHSASPRTPGQAPRPDTSQSISRGEQDAAESLLFMSSPGNSESLKRPFAASGSPGPQPIPPRSRGTRHALPSGPRKALPSQRPAFPSKKTGRDRSPDMAPPADSPMDLDQPAHIDHSPNRGPSKRRTNGATHHVRSSLSLPSGLGLGKGGARKVLGDEDIERMLDRAGAETADSSDDGEIELPPGRRGVAGVMGS